MNIERNDDASAVFVLKLFFYVIPPEARATNRQKLQFLNFFQHPLLLGTV